jgi:hypothetical protein
VTADDLAKRLEAKRNGRGWMAKCPSHDDGQASLRIAAGDDGQILLHCFAGCSVESVVAGLGLTMADLFGKGRRGGTRPGNRVGQSHTAGAGLTLEHYAEAKRLPLAFLREIGLSEISYCGARAVRIPYLDQDGHTVAVQYRVALSGEERFNWKKGSKPVPYGLSRLRQARNGGVIALVEGASDCQTLWHYGIAALGMPSASTWHEEWDQYLEGFGTVLVVLEPDKGGDTVATRAGRSAFHSRASFVRLDGAKDPSELHIRLKNEADFLARWQDATLRAIPWATFDRDRRSRVAAPLYAKVKHMLEDPHLLDRVGEAMKARGYVGDLGTPLVVYLALVSRELERPQNLAIVAPSAAGKNRALDAPLDLMPPETVHIVSAGSPRALVYTDEPFEHRHVIFREADSIPENGSAGSALRAIVEDSCLVYEVVECNPRNGRHETRQIRKAGPVGLITTSTRSLGPQLSTRLLEVNVPDDEEQTRKVMEAHATKVQPPNGQSIDVNPFLDLQRWLREAGVRQVSIPFAHVLAQLVPAKAVRMRRDFRQLLTTIQACAFLYQCQRERTPEGWTLATLDDYEIARRLLSPVFDALAAEMLTPVVRATVEAVREDEEISVTDLGRRLNIAKSTAAYRVRRALAGGWLVNQESRRQQPARLARGAGLPDPLTALPSVEQVRAFLSNCSSDFGKSGSPRPPGPETGDCGEDSEYFDA